MDIKNIAIACQGGGSHAAYSAGVLQELLPVFEEKKDELYLVGISGTSGGAICALLAWYGLLTDGPKAAGWKLASFWQSNCAQLPGEQLWNDWLIKSVESLSYDIKFSPYNWPLHESEEFFTQVWPSMAKMLGDWNFWMRSDFFQLGELIRPHVDFEVVARLGEFCSIPLAIKRWLTAEYEANLLDSANPHRQQLDRLKGYLRKKIEDGLAAPANLKRMMDVKHIPSHAPLRIAMAKWEEKTWEFEPRSLVELLNAVLAVTNDIPQLLLGAVDIGNGNFFAFSSERSPRDGGISIKSVLASTALPWLFQAVSIEQEEPDGNSVRTHQYWDGLFSQNPPIKNFISGLLDDRKKPDELWVVQINPNEFILRGDSRQSNTPVVDALSGNEIWHTRDALSGNLSLNQEISFLESINKMLDDNAESEAQYGKRPNYKHVQVHRIVMDSSAVESALTRKLGTPKKLGVFSKFDRSPVLKDCLVHHGYTQAMHFVSMRDVVARASNDLNSIPSTDTVSGHPMGAAVAALKSLRSEDGNSVRVVVDETTLHHLHGIGDGAEPQVTLHWHTRGKTAQGESISVEGDAKLAATGHPSMIWRLKDVSIESIASIKQAVAAVVESRSRAA